MHLCEGCGRQHDPCCPDCSCLNAQDDSPQSLLDAKPDMQALVLTTMDLALYQHRGKELLDGRWHCVCGWVSRPERGLADLARDDVREHLLVSMVALLQERVG